MKILLNLLLAAGLTGLAYSIIEIPFTAVGVFNFGFVTALVAWTLAQYEPRKRPLWRPKISRPRPEGAPADFKPAAN